MTKKPICLSCKWRDWYIEVFVKKSGPIFNDVCPYHKTRLMRIYKQEDCQDFTYIEVE